jgi:hypothetical protein
MISFRRPRVKALFTTTTAALLIVASCTPSGNLRVGPVRVTANIGEASFLQTIFSVKGGATVVHKQKFCDMPTEEELQEEVTTVGEIDLSTFIRLDKLELVETKITATSGNFNFLTAMSIRFLPKPGAGNPVVLGAAINPNGFGTEIVLEPEDGVDFLALIRANDEADPNDCPRIEYTMTFQSLPSQDVEYTLDVTVDGYAEVGREKVLQEIAH